MGKALVESAYEVFISSKTGPPPAQIKRMPQHPVLM